jgi:hypothetical protein
LFAPEAVVLRTAVFFAGVLGSGESPPVQLHVESSREIVPVGDPLLPPPDPLLLPLGLPLDVPPDPLPELLAPLLLPVPGLPLLLPVSELPLELPMTPESYPLTTEPTPPGVELQFASTTPKPTNPKATRPPTRIGFSVSTSPRSSSRWTLVNMPN